MMAGIGYAVETCRIQIMMAVSMMDVPQFFIATHAQTTEQYAVELFILAHNLFFALYFIAGNTRYGIMVQQYINLHKSPSMTKKLLLILLCHLCFGACKAKYAAQKAGKEIVVIDIDKALHASGQLRFSDFVDSISFIPIYDGRNAHIGDPLYMTITRNHLLVYDMTDRLVCYDFKEQKSRQIGMRGRGPNEYLRMEAFAVDEASGIIYTLIQNTSTSSGVLYKYDFEGRFLGDISLEEAADNIGLIDNGNLAVHFTNYNRRAKSQYSVINGKGKIITDYHNSFLYQLYGQRSMYSSESARYNYDGEFHIKDKSDTLYVFRGAERYPKYVFKNSYSIDSKQNLSQADYDCAFVLNYIFETPTKLVFNGHLGGSEHDKWHYFYYDKITGQTHSIDRYPQNDLTDGFPKVLSQATSDTTFGNCYVKIIPNTHSTLLGYPQDDEASYFVMLFHLK